VTPQQSPQHSLEKIIHIHHSNHNYNDDDSTVTIVVVIQVARRRRTWFVPPSSNQPLKTISSNSHHLSLMVVLVFWMMMAAGCQLRDNPNNVTVRVPIPFVVSMVVVHCRFIQILPPVYDVGWPIRPIWGIQDVRTVHQCHDVHTDQYYQFNDCTCSITIITASDSLFESIVWQ
jgi:hypothetical protein